MGHWNTLGGWEDDPVSGGGHGEGSGGHGEGNGGGGGPNGGDPNQAGNPYYANRPQSTSDVIVSSNGQVLYVDKNGNWVNTGLPVGGDAAHAVATALGMDPWAATALVQRAQDEQQRTAKNITAGQYGQVLSSAGNGQYIVQLGDGTKQVMAAADAAKVPGIYQADLDQAENDRMYRQYRGNEASFQAAGWDPRHLATLQGDNGTVPSSGANVFGPAPNVQQQGGMPQYGQQQQAGMPQQQGMTPSWMQRPASAQTGQQPPPSGQTGYPPPATQTGYAPPATQTGYAPPASYGYGGQTGVAPGASSYTQRDGQTGGAPGGSSYSPYSAGSSLTQSPSTSTQSPSSSSPTQASMGQPGTTGSTGSTGGTQIGDTRIDPRNGGGGNGSFDLSSFKIPNGMTNQQAQDLETQLKQWQTFANVPRYQRITAGANGSYSGEDFLGGHQTLSKDQALQTGSATADELFKAQSDYADQQKQLGLQIRSQQSRNMSGFDPNQVNSSIAGMH